MTEENKPRPKRRRFLVDKPFQFHLIIYFVVLLVLGEVLSGLIFYLVAHREMTVGFYRAHSQLRSVWDLLMPAVIITELVTVVVIVAAAGLFLAWYSHRIAGPLLRIERVSRAMAKGNFREEVRIRSEDSIQSLAESIGSLNVYLTDQFRELGGVLADMDEALEGKRNWSDPHLCQLLDSCHQRLKEVVSRFEIRDLE